MLLRSRHDDTPISDAEIRDHVITLLIQGHEPTAVAVAWTFERLARHPEILERLRAELEAGREDYLDAVFNEGASRSPARAADRANGRQALPAREYEIEPGWLIACNALAMHLRPDLYPEPDRFSPERFLEQSPASSPGFRSAAGSGTASAAPSRPTRRGTSSGPWSRGSASARGEGRRRRSPRHPVDPERRLPRGAGGASSRPSRPGRRIRREARRPGGTGSEQCGYENDETDDQQRHDQQGEA